MSLPTRLLLLAALAFAGCTSPEDYARNNTATAGWLASQAGHPEMNIAGRWHSEDWGEAEFKQKGNRVTGILGAYPVGGVIRGRTLYLAITEDGWTNETAILQLTNSVTLEGFYSDSVPFHPIDVEAIQLRRVVR